MVIKRADSAPNLGKHSDSSQGLDEGASLIRQAIIGWLSGRASHSIGPAEIQEQAAGFLVQALNVDRCGIWELVPDGTTLVLRAGAGWRSEDLGQWSEPAEEDSLIGRTLLSDKGFVIEDWGGGTRSHALQAEEQDACSVVTVPMRTSSRLTGVLSVHAPRGRTFATQEIEFIQAVADHVAGKLECTESGQTGLLFADVFSHAPIGLAVWRWDESGGEEAVSLVTTNRAMTDNLALLTEDHLDRCGDVIRSGRGQDWGEVCRTDEHGSHTFSVRAFPLPANSVCVAFQEITHLKRAEEELRSVISELDRQRQEVERLNRSLEGRIEERTEQLQTAETQAMTDELTGLSNNRAFRADVIAEVIKAEQLGDDVGLIMLDIDGFKTINDSRGHMAGDQILAKLGSTLAEEVPKDGAYRFGGDEFAILLPGCNDAETLRVAERLRSVVKKVVGDSAPVTISLGVASFPRSAASVEVLVYGADAAMYWAKSSGKNQVRAWRELTGQSGDGLSSGSAEFAPGNGFSAGGMPDLHHLIEVQGGGGPPASTSRDPKARGALRALLGIGWRRVVLYLLVAGFVVNHDPLIGLAIHGEVSFFDRAVLLDGGLMALVTTIPIVFMEVQRRRLLLDSAVIEQSNITLQEREDYFRSLIENSSDVITVLDGSVVRFESPAIEQLTGYTPGELIGADTLEFIHAEDRPRIAELLFAMRNDPGTIRTAEFRVRAKDGTLRTFESVGKAHIDDSGTVRVVVNSRDITDRRRAEEALRESELRFRTLGESTAAAMIIYQGTRIVFANRAAELLSGYTSGELALMSFWDVIAPEFRGRVKMRGLMRGRGDDVPTRYETKIERKDGEERWVDSAVGRIEFDGSPAVLVTAFDVTDRKEAEARVRFLAYHDPLTGLPNRHAAVEFLASAIERAGHDGIVAALHVDLDKFRVINDTIGHSAGDELLKIVGEEFARQSRDTDSVARIGADEFLVVLTGLTVRDEVRDIAQRILEGRSQPHMIGDHEFVVTASAGISVYPRDGSKVEDLLRCADMALHQAKRQGANSYRFYDGETSSTELLEEAELSSALSHALENEEFIVYYQPQADAASGEIVGVEALVRWRHPDGSIVAPDAFIPLAERTGLIQQLDRWVLRTACAQAVTWREMGLPDLRMAVNVSSRRFEQINFHESVATVLEETGLAPENLELEITERLAMQDTDHTLAMLRNLSSMGVKIAVDDFGTGHSALAYLKTFPVDVIKIDRSFVKDFSQDPDATAIVRAIIALARALNLRTIAEGVETEEQRACLIELGCDEIQGYLLSRPVPASELFSEGAGDGASRRPLLHTKPTQRSVES